MDIASTSVEYDDNRLNIVFYGDAWLGEQEKKFAKSNIVEAGVYDIVILRSL